MFHVCVLFLSSTPQPMQYAQELARKKRKATKEVYVHMCFELRTCKMKCPIDSIKNQKSLAETYLVLQMGPLDSWPGRAAAELALSSVVYRVLWTHSGCGRDRLPY